jgi:hypothetical protein
MTIKELVELACEESPSFHAKVQWYRNRNRPRETIDLEWLMPLLEEALGKERVENAAQEEIEKQEALDGSSNEVQT